MKLASARRTASCGNGPSAARARASRPISATRMPISSARLSGARKGAALALPFADTAAMQLHLDEISRHVAMGRARRPAARPRRMAYDRKLNVPENITPILLPSRSPELNPVENVWQYLRANWLSNRVFETYDDIIDAALPTHGADLIAQPDDHSIGMRDGPHIGQTS